VSTSLADDRDCVGGEMVPAQHATMGASDLLERFRKREERWNRRRALGQETVQVSVPRISFSMSPGPRRRVASSPCFTRISSRVGFSTE